MGRKAMVRAAGGVVVARVGGEPRLAVVHRPAYGDWTLPKGKCEPGEAAADCARREVEEETSLRCRRVVDLGTTEHLDDAGRSKQVSWWLMRPVSGELRADTEADEARWVTAAEALDLLSYENDRSLVSGLARESRVWLVRHADAGERRQPDDRRALDQHGRQQASALAQRLRAEGVTSIASSPSLRCRQTLEPLGAVLALDIEIRRDLAEGSGLRGVLPLLVSGQSVAACTHGDVLEALLRELAADGLVRPGAPAQKAGTWCVRASLGIPTSAEYWAPPV
jgi:8-oxo-(d)GTP phosphatase